MKKLFFLFILFSSAAMFAQNAGAIKGLVLDNEMNNEPMMMANIELKSADNNLVTQSNLFGSFEINNIEPGNYELAITFAGYESANLPIEIKKDEVLEIQQVLSAQSLSLEEFMLVREKSHESNTIYSVASKDGKE